MVEAAGIEPASESTTLKPLHAYPDYLFSGISLPPGRPPDILSLNLSPELRASSGGILLYDALFSAQASLKERAAIG
jgi:hypothetical protein